VALNLPAEIALPAARSPRALLGTDGSAGPATLIGWALADWCVIALAWTAMTRIGGLPIAVVGTIVVASRLHALGAILHDACHQGARRRSPAWLAVEMLAGWPIASTIEAMRYHHLRHHAASGTPADPYHGAVQARSVWRRWLLCLRGAALPFWWTLRALVAPIALALPALRTGYARAFLQDRSGRELRHHPAVLSCLRADLLQLTAQAIALGAALAADLPVLGFYVLPWMLAGILNARRVVYEHAWLTSATRSRQQAWATTVDHDLGPIGNAIFYPHGIGWHRIHHLYPTVAFVHLRRLATEILSAQGDQT